MLGLKSSSNSAWEFPVALSYSGEYVCPLFTAPSKARRIYSGAFTTHDVPHTIYGSLDQLLIGSPLLKSKRFCWSRLPLISIPVTAIAPLNIKTRHHCVEVFRPGSPFTSQAPGFHLTMDTLPFAGFRHQYDKTVPMTF